jgi:hypothetical protein
VTATVAAASSSTQAPVDHVHSDSKEQDAHGMQERAQRAIVVGVRSLKLLRLLQLDGLSDEEFNTRVDTVCAFIREHASEPDLMLDVSIAATYKNFRPTLLAEIVYFAVQVCNKFKLAWDNARTQRVWNCLKDSGFGLAASWKRDAVGGETIFFTLLACWFPTSALGVSWCTLFHGLVRAGISINHRDSSGNNCLLAKLSAMPLDKIEPWPRNTYFLEFLHDLGLDLNAANHNGETLLHICVQKHALDLLQQIATHPLFALFDLFVPDSQGRTPRKLAEQLAREQPTFRKRLDIAELMQMLENTWLQHKQPFVMRTMDRVTPLIPDLADIVLAYLIGERGGAPLKLSPQ